MDERIKLIELICDYFGMNINQIEELKFCLDQVRSLENGFGNVKIVIKRKKIFNFVYTIEGMPTNLNDNKDE